MIRRAITTIVGLALLVVVGVLIANAFPGIIGADHSYTVLSGSMEPAISTGSVIFVADTPAEQIDEGDVITYAESPGVTPTTHRVVEKHEADSSVRFETKGDANENRDPEPVYRDEIVGVVILTIPLLGYLVTFAGTQTGWLVLVIVPVALLFLDGMWTLWSAIEFEAEAETE